MVFILSEFYVFTLYDFFTTFGVIILIHYTNCIAIVNIIII